jgi:hypothetical protein
MLLLTASIKRIKCYHNNRWKMCLPKRCCPYRYQKITNKMIPTMWMTWLYLPSQMCSSTNPSLDKSWSHWVRLMKADASITPRSQMTKQFLKIKNNNSSKIYFQKRRISFVQSSTIWKLFCEINLFLHIFLVRFSKDALLWCL